MTVFLVPQIEEMITQMTPDGTTSFLIEPDYEDDPTHKDPWVGVCLTCWGVGDSSRKRVKWVNWKEKGEIMDAHLCKPCWKSLKIIIKNRTTQEVDNEST